MGHTAPDVARADAIGLPPRRPTQVPADCYYSTAFADLEVARMWPRVWLVACSVDLATRGRPRPW